ncbi:MAG: hypothetical protein GPOALKHO_001233 [Sodalis sp.]|nr:MAG: hypothetical protein GPOALKHO_001233 [Sodalis sp.]
MLLGYTRKRKTALKGLSWPGPRSESVTRRRLSARCLRCCIKAQRRLYCAASGALRHTIGKRRTPAQGVKYRL